MNIIWVECCIYLKNNYELLLRLCTAGVNHHEHPHKKNKNSAQARKLFAQKFIWRYGRHIHIDFGSVWLANGNKFFHRTLVTVENTVDIFTGIYDLDFRKYSAVLCSFFFFFLQTHWYTNITSMEATLLSLMSKVWSTWKWIMYHKTTSVQI